MEIAVYLLQKGSGSGQRFSLDEFFERVSELEREDLAVSIHHARVVLEVLQEAVSNVRAHLRGEFDRLFDAGS